MKYNDLALQHAPAGNGARQIAPVGFAHRAGAAA